MSNVSEVLRDKKFVFNKQFGQNFITDNNLLDAIVADSWVTADDVVVEIGTGAGTLTKAISKVAKKVISFEIDRNLKDILDVTLSGVDNVEVIFRDIMKVTDSELKELVGANYKVVANLPYYITTPIIMRFLEGDFKPQSLTIMVQKEVAERLTAKAGTSDYGAITAVVELYANAKITRIVGKNNFYPVPKVDSSVIRLDICDNKYDCDKEKVKQIIKAAFAMRRKTLVNNLMALGLSREVIEKTLQNLDMDVRIRGEVLNLQNFMDLAKILL
ncbi:MAG: 16S rRNA (adenine(1518)-N(6)/adenine(1519)-N(6))-dimethyltransferase RsmA [Clostridia bacterium]|nr:16S rRNA (adenine(1518)-N(6)/adenine(1519)-N(6))-dimethyltransferase RsmA [Clostridia bacterium]